MRRGRPLFAWLMLALCACATPQGPTNVAAPGPAAAPPPIRDAGPLAFEEDEVDVPARPALPIRPAYPPELRALGIEGDVTARVIVLADGSYGGARLVESSHPGFTETARDALHAARFEPAQRDGRAVASWVTVRVRFRLEP